MEMLGRTGTRINRLKTWQWLCVIFIAAIILRVAFVVVWDRDYELPDTGGYIAVAENILNGNGFVVSDDTRVGRAPVYPLFLSVCFLVFGKSEGAVHYAQGMIGALVCLPVFFLGRMIDGARCGLFAASIAALYPPWIFYTRLILTEAIFIPLMALGVLLLISLSKEFRWSSAAGAGLCFGAAILLRPSILWLWPLAIMAVLGVSARPKAALGSVVVASAVIASVMFPWVLRNYRVTGRFVPTTLITGWSLYEANSAKATGGPAQHIVDWPVKRLIGLSEYERDEYLRNEALGYIRKHPCRFLSLACVKFWRTWTPLPNDSQFRTPLIILLSAGSYLPLMVLGVLGIWATKQKWRQWVLVLLPVIYYMIVHSVFVGSIRYRTPVMYALMVAAAVVIARLTRFAAKRRPETCGDVDVLA